MSMLLRRYHEKASDEAVAEEVQAPAGNASTETWHEYALSQGRTPEELDGLTRDQLRELFN